MYNSQYSQDEIVHKNFFKDKKNGYFVDIGAYDGITQGSNSLFFEELGWTGVCVEPNPNLFEKLKQNRKCKCYNVAIDNNIGEMNFMLIKGHDAPNTLGRLIDDTNTIDVSRLKNNLNQDQTWEIIVVKTEIFDNVVDNNKIDYLSIDTEGNEIRILETIDFEKYDISVLSLENNYRDARYENFFKDKPYTRFTNTGCDEIWVKNSILEENK